MFHKTKFEIAWHSWFRAYITIFPPQFPLNCFSSSRSGLKWETFWCAKNFSSLAPMIVVLVMNLLEFPFTLQPYKERSWRCAMTYVSMYRYCRCSVPVLFFVLFWELTRRYKMTDQRKISGISSRLLNLNVELSTFENPKKEKLCQLMTEIKTLPKPTGLLIIAMKDKT